MIKTSLAPMPPAPTVSWQEQVQVALAVGNEGLLRRILTDSWPAVLRPSRIGSVQAEVAVPMGERGQWVDGLLKVGRVVCALAGSHPEVPPEPVIHDHNHYQFLTGCVSGLYTLAHNQPLSQVLALLAKVGFAEEAIDQILNLPYQAWHKSWWYQADAEGSLSIPFQRFIRTRRYGDGTLTLQYKDYYAQEPPEGFFDAPVQLPVVIRRPQEGFMATLERINQARQALAAERALLVVDALSPVEVEGFTNQKVSVYSPQALAVAAPADCYHCIQEACPLQGQVHSPVLVCQGYVRG